MASQLIKVTNAYSGHVTYIVQAAIVCFYTAVQGPTDKANPSGNYKLPVKTWICFSPTEDAMPIAETVDHILHKFPPL